MTPQTIELERDGAVMVLRLNRPDRLNAVNNAMLDDLHAAFDQVDADNDVRALVVTGAGRAFCAGADLAGGGDTFDHAEETFHQDKGGVLNLRIFELTKPVIAAINGPMVGLGATMTLPMDIRVASDTTKVGFVFSRRGIVADGCSSWFLPRIVGISKALEWTMSGRVFPIAEGLAAGLVRDVVPGEEVLALAVELARDIAENTSAISVTINRALMWRMLGADHPMEATRAESLALHAVGGTPDSIEGVMAFLEKRPAKYPGQVPADLPGMYPWWPDRPFTPLT